MATADWASFRADQLTLQSLCTSFRGVLRCLSASHCFPSLLHYHGSFRYNIPIDIVTNSLLRSLQYPFWTSRGDGRALRTDWPFACLTSTVRRRWFQIPGSIYHSSINRGSWPALTASYAPDSLFIGWARNRLHGPLDISSPHLHTVLRW